MILRQARTQAKKQASQRRRLAPIAEVDSATVLCAGDEVLYFGPKDAAFASPKLATLSSDVLMVDAHGSEVCHDIVVSGTKAIATDVPACRLQDVRLAPADVVKRARANTARAQRRMQSLAKQTASEASATADNGDATTMPNRAQAPPTESLTPSPARLAEIGAAAAQDMDEIRDRVACAVCCCSVKVVDTSAALVTEQPPARWLSKLQVLSSMNLHVELRAQYQLQDADADVHPQWLDMLLYPDSTYSSAPGEWSIDVCDSCRRSLNGTSKSPPKNSIVRLSRPKLRSPRRLLSHHDFTSRAETPTLRCLLHQANGNYRGFATMIPELAALKPPVSSDLLLLRGSNRDFIGQTLPPFHGRHICCVALILTKRVHVSSLSLQELDLLRRAVTRQVTKVQLSFSGSPDAVRCTAKTTISMRKLGTAEYRDVLNDVSTPTVSTHVCIGNVKPTAAGVQAAIERRILHAKVRVREYTVAHDKLNSIKPSFDQPSASDLALDDESVPRGTLVFSYGSTTQEPTSTSGDTPETVADSAGEQLNGRATMIIGDAETADSHSRPEVLLGTDGFESMWHETGHFRAFPDIYPFDRGGPKEERPVPMSWQAHASLLLRCWDRTAARNQTWILIVYDSVVKMLATRDCMSAATRAAGDNPSDAIQVTVSREELQAATKHHEAKHNALRAGKPLPSRPAELSASAEQMLRSLSRSTRLIPGTTEHALNRRNQFWALNVFMGCFSHWNTTSQSDATDDAITDVSVGKTNHDRSPEMVLKVNAADPGACVMYYSELVNVYVHRILGWNRSTNAAVPGGGVFGELAGFAGTTEDQARKSLHLHSLATTKAFPKTTADMLDFLVKPANVRDLVHHMDTVQSQCHPCHAHEFTGIGDLGHLCPPSTPNALPRVTQAPATICDVPAGYRAVTKVLKLDYPKLLLCECGESETSQSMVRAWALNTCGDDVRESYLAGNTRLSGFKLDFDLLMLPPPPASSRERFAWDLANAKERAKLTLIGINVMEHKPGHMRSCFKHTNTTSGSASKRPTCRFRLPAMACSSSAIVVDGKVVCDCVEPCTDESHLTITASYTLGDVSTMELRVHRPAGFEYTNNHNMIELAVFRMNTDTTVTLGRPGMVYYVTTYATKLPEASSSAAAIMLAHDRAAARMGQLVQSPRQILNSRTASYLHACTRVQEVSVTMAAKYLLDGSLHYSSHSFEKVYVNNIIAFYDKTGFTVSMVPDAQETQHTTRPRGYKAVVPQFLDYVLRDDMILPNTDYYDFVSTHTRVKAVFDPDNPGRHLPLHNSHPLNKTHCISLRRHPVVPQMVGKRLANTTTLNDNDADTNALYQKTVLALYKPHSSRAPPWSVDEPVNTAHAAWIPSPTASSRLSRHQDYYDQQKLAKNSAKMRAAVRQTMPQNDEQGICYDDFDDGGAEMLDAVALQAVGGAPPTRSMPASLRDHLMLVDASVTAGTATLCSKAGTFDAACLAVANAAPPTTAAWNPVPDSHVGDATIGDASGASFDASVPRALLVSSALTAAAEATAANPRSAAAAAVQVTHPTLAAVSNKFHLNDEQSAAFRIACLPLLLFFLNLADDHTSTDFATAKTELAKHGASTAAVTLALIGEGGTGKSEVIKAISHFASTWGLRRHLAITAPTGSAAILVDGCTLHSWAGIGIRKASAKRNLSSAQLADDPVNSTVVLIIDEVSLVSAELLGRLSNTLQRKRNSNKPFGGLSVVFSGDMHQLKPVQGTPLFDTSSQADNAGPTAQAGFDAWRSLSHVVMLQTNYRAAKDPVFMALLRRLRNHTVTYDDLDTLRACRVSDTHMPPVDAAAAWYANKDVNATNSATVMYAAALSNKRVFRLSASVRPSKHDTPLPTTDSSHAGYVVGSRTHNRNDLPVTHLDVYLGCPVTMYVNNKLTKYKIAKGSRGILIGAHPPLETLIAENAEPTKVELPDGSAHDVHAVHTLPEYLLVHVPGSTVHFDGLPVGTFPVRVKSESINVHGHASKMHVSQFPVKLNFAWTCHKLQGKTEQCIVLGATNKILNFNYTALSRVRSLKDLFILKGVKLALHVLNQTSEHYVMLVADMHRLDKLSIETLTSMEATVALPSAVQVPPSNIGALQCPPNTETHLGDGNLPRNATEQPPSQELCMDDTVAASGTKSATTASPTATESRPAPARMTANPARKKKKKQQSSRSKPVTFASRQSMSKRNTTL